MMDNKTEQKLDEMLGQLRKQAAPERDLWPDIQARLEEPEKGESQWRYYAAAAALCLALMAGYKATDSTESPVPAVVENNTPAYTVPNNAPVQLPTPVARLSSYPGASYHLARDTELHELEVHIKRLPETQQQVVRDNLATIHKALAEIDAALADDPDNRVLKDLLLQTYQRELSTINRVNRISGSLRKDL